MRTGESERRVRIDARGKLAAWFLGLALGMGVNLLSDDVGYRGVAAAAVIGAMLMATNWLQGLPTRTRLADYIPPVLLTLALLATVLSVVAPRAWAGPATLVAAGLVGTAVLIPTDLATAGRLLAGAAFIGFGVALIGIGVAWLRDGNQSNGTADIGLGLGGIGIGMAWLRDGNLLADAAFTVRGVADLRASALLAGAAAIGVGVVTISGGVAVLHSGGGLMAGMPLIGGGVAVIGVGVARLHSSALLYGVALIGSGVAGIGVGVAALRTSGPLYGAAVISIGVAFIGAGVLVGGRGVVDRARDWWDWLMEEPTQPERPVSQ